MAGYYCMLSHIPNAVPEGLRCQPSLHNAMNMIRQVLDSNDTLSPAVLSLFCRFPYPLDVVGAKWPSQMQHQAELFLSFMTHSPNIDQMKRICRERRYPPLVRELAVDLRIASPTFRRLLFTSLLRSMWKSNPQTQLQAHYEAQAVETFQHNQATFCQQEAYAASVEPPFRLNHEQEKAQEAQRWAPQLKQIVDEFESRIRDHGVPLPSQYAAVHQQPYQTPHAQSQPSQPSVMVSRPSRPVITPSGQRGRGRPHPRPLLNLNPPAVPSQTQQNLSTPLLPPVGWTQPHQRLPNPARFSLHNAHLRSPILQAQSVPSSLYQFMVGWALSPTPVPDADREIARLTFTLSGDEMQIIPKTVPGAQGGPDIRTINDQSKTARLRSIKWSDTANTPRPSEHIWAVTDTTWIPYSFITFNGTSLHQRKKVHHGRDMPIDITGLLKEGENVLEVAVMAQSHETSHQNYLLAVEVLGFQTHNAIKQMCTAKRIPAAQVVDSIKRKLSGTSDDEDEICIVQSNLTVNLFDPFSASQPCDIPVRSTTCLHNDCFDLETFLQTRRRVADSSVADQWRCPICNADARPQRLFVDGFMQHVYQTLEAQGLGETRAIVVHQDGSWSPKAEVRDPNGVSDEPPSPTLPVARRTVTPRDNEIIDLSD
ncbi:hypothetical protein N0V83_008120 [Neocucurbitaria cava]|uniref:SP-RING-type domain-containing protein n=1 Tax=Neocucurbitaria cava TaxID=798079 RepID=A0A9W8Y434_9PLEO|nr:hypothetical protein N0V83_008120 [Neocucurbitaria cava]